MSQHEAEPLTIPADAYPGGSTLVADLEVIATALAYQLNPRLAELAELLRSPAPVRLRPSDRVSLWEQLARAEPIALPGGTLDQLRIMVRNIGADVVYIGATPELAANGGGRLILNPSESLTIETRARLWVCTDVSVNPVQLTGIIELSD